VWAVRSNNAPAPVQGGAAPPPTATATLEPTVSPTRAEPSTVGEPAPTEVPSGVPTVSTTRAEPSSTEGEPAPSGVPTSGQSAPPSPLDEYVRRCRGVTKDLSPALVVWQPTYRMTVGREAAINVAITLRTSALPSQVLPGANSPTAESVLVACRVTGVLRIDTAAFSVADDTPLAQSVKILSSEDARWHWLVTPSKAGRFTASAELKPIVSLQGASDPQPVDEELPSKSFDAVVIVNAPADQAISDTTGRLTAVLLKLTALLAAIAALLAAAVRLFTGAWLPWRKSAGAAQEPENPDST
jgi:hypothetical protein